MNRLLRDSCLVFSVWLVVACSATDGADVAGSGGAVDGAGGADTHLGGSGGNVVGAGGLSSSGGVSSGSAPSSGGMVGAGGGGDPTGSGGAAEEPSITELINSFDAFWDFEMVQNASVSSVIGDANLELDGAIVESGSSSQQLTLSGALAGARADSSIIDTAGSFSISTWVKLDELNDYNTFVSIDGSAISAVYLQTRGDKRLALTTFAQDSEAATPCITTAEIQPRLAEWYHVVGTYDATSRVQRIYVDGVLSSKTSCPDGVFSASGPLRLGSGMWDAAQTDFVSGALDDVGVVSRALTPRDVLDLYRAGAGAARYYLFSYFVEVTQGRGDGLRLAHSHDGLHWGAIGAGKVFMPPSVGGGSFRDPHVMRDPTGLYHLVWTTSCVPWAESNCVQDRGFGHATSPNLVDWSAADYVLIDLNVEHVWAPETYFDEKTSQFMVFFSSPVDNNPSASDPHSLYYVLTSDFVSYSAPQILYAQSGRNFIDGTIRAHGNEYLMILKDEADGQKNLRALLSPQLFGPDAWTGSPSAALTGNYAAEGPSFLERDGELFVYFDKYGDGAYGALQATSSAQLTQPASWHDISASVFFPGVRHGTPIEVPWEVFEQVALVAGQD